MTGEKEQRRWRYTHTKREPFCVHERIFTQPMSACDECQHHPELAEWRRYWSDMAVLFGREEQS
jgi:hypothetical protein